MRLEDFWGSLASQPSWTSEIQASERYCLTKQGGQLSREMIPKADLWLLHAHTHTCTCACTLQHIRTHACTHWWVPQNHLKKEPNIRRGISSNLFEKVTLRQHLSVLQKDKGKTGQWLLREGTDDFWEDWCLLGWLCWLSLVDLLSCEPMIDVFFCLCQTSIKFS